MCMGGSKSPKPLAPPPEPPEPPKDTDPAVAQARSDERRRAALAAGRGATILTGAQGVTDQANTTKKTLLGV